MDGGSVKVRDRARFRVGVRSVEVEQNGTRRMNGTKELQQKSTRAT